MRLLVDRHIPFLSALDAVPGLSVVWLEPEAFTPSCVRTADALFVRTRTHVDASLLEGSAVRLVATATIGFDHLDTSFCSHHGVAWTSCPGCNSQAVCDYVQEALLTLCPRCEGLTLGVVGVGHVGTKVVAMAQRLGFRVLTCDPPKHLGVSLDEIADKCDVITFHTPLTSSGDYPTRYLCSDAFLRRCRQGAVIINAARGGIVCEHDLLCHLDSGHISACCIDCWEHEPDLSVALLSHPSTRLASFHIAGYSLLGKYNASRMCVEALLRHFPSLSPSASFLFSSMESDYLHAVSAHLGDTSSGWLLRLTSQLKQSPSSFESLRKNYPLR